MTTAREHFALDWIKADLLETLNEARLALDDYAELGGDETRMRACLTGLHQVHGTLVMLELKGVTQLADHLEQLAQAMLGKQVADEGAAGQALMQGILELPGYFDELQRGAEDSVSTSMALVNEIRTALNLEPLADPAGGSLREGASDEVVARFNAIGGPEKVSRMRSAYQSVLLSILKGEDRAVAVRTLGKIAVGLEKVTTGAPLQRQWQAFAEFVTSLTQHTGVLESEAVKILRRVDVEIKNLAKDGEAVLRRPVNMELLQQLLDGAIERDNVSAAVTGLQEAVHRDVSNNTLAISGRQALGSAAGALQEDLVLVKDKLDLLVRAETVNLEELRALVTPLKQMGSTLSLLGFESSREIVADQVDAIENLVVLGDGDPQGVQHIATALIQVDENLKSVILGSGQTEVEQITSEAQLQVLREARKDLDHIKQCVVDFVTAHWSIGHLETIPEKLADICGALEIIPLSRAIGMLRRIDAYTKDRLMQGHRPEWQELDQFADVISAVDYYLERLADENSAGADDILVVAERSLTELEQASADLPQAAPVEQQTDQVQPPVEAEPAPAEAAEVAVEAPAMQAEAQTAAHETGQEVDTQSETIEGMEQTAAQANVEAHEQDAAEEVIDPGNLTEVEEPKLTLEEDPGFDLGSDVFATLEGTIEPAQQNSADAADAIKAGEAEAADATASEAVTEAAESAAAAIQVELPEVEAPDPEIVEIFVEEIDEVLENIAEYLPQWAQNFDNTEALKEVRRAFHTLKGSGRIVQAVAIGELAWGVENMLNRVMDGTVSANAQFVSVIDAALELVPGLRDAFAQGDAGDLVAISAVIDQADVLSSGGEIDIAPAQPSAESPTAEVENAAEESPADEIKAEELPVDEVLDDEIPVAETIEPADTAVEDLALQPETVDTPVAPQQPVLEPTVEPEVAEELSTLDLFVAEAREHLAAIQAANAEVPWTLSDPIARAFHTLVGGAALAQLQEVQLIVEPAHQVVDAFRNAEPSDELQQFFVAAATHLDECLSALAAQADWEEPFEFVALADDLLAARGTAPRAVDQLLDAPATAAMFDAEEGLAAYLAAGVGGADSDMAQLQAVLHELATVAADMKALPLGGLASALALALETAQDASQIPVPCGEVMRRAYDQLIDQLNEIAAGSEIAAQDELVSELAALDFNARAEAPESDVVAAASDQAIDAAPDPEEIEPEVSAQDNDQFEIAELAAIDPDLVQVFFEEADEINEELEASILSWSQERDNRIYMENMLRGLHTLKGGARLCGLAKLGDMAHDFESVVIEVQTDERPIDDALFAELNRRYDEIAKRLIEVNTQLDQVGMPAADNVVELPVVETPPAQPKPSVSEVNKVLESAAAPAAAPESDVTPAEPAPPIEEQAAKPEPAAAGERHNNEMVRVGSALLEELVNLAGESSILRARMEQGMSDFTGALDEMETTIERLREQLRRLEIETETQILHRHERTDGPQYENFDPLEMDRYNQMQQLSRSLSESASDMNDLKETLLFKARESETLLLQQARINTELQEGLMRTRMVPFSRLMPRLRRIVRQVSAELDKDIEFHVQNAEGELDRNLLERMVPPLEHMLRNAVDHGIESAEMRRNYGKSATGRIDLRLTREGGDVVIEISDDGAGIDVEGVRAKAIERGLMAADAKLTDEEALQFVLAPGFTTAKLVTQISGRGVGLDVVHSEVKQLGGSVNILSRPGKGTRFIVRVPFTVSVNRALMVSVAEDLYAIPLNTIEGIVLLSPDELQALYSSDGKSFEYAGVPYRVRYLGQYLGREYRGVAGGQASVPMVLVRSGDHAVAIHVDLVQGSREIVVKSLGPQFAGVGGISGATILGDGSVVVILDLLALIRAQYSEGARRSRPVYATSSGPRCIMVVDDSVTVRKVTSRLLERQGMDVLVAKDGVEAVALLQERRPDVMLLDIEMPRMDGFEVARQVRHDDRLSDLPIVMISSRTGDKHKEHASQLGVNKFLGKPFQENELLATIDELVTRS